MAVDSDVQNPSWLPRPATLAAGGVAVVDFPVAPGSTNLAPVAGEQAITLLPAGTGKGSLAAIVATHAVVVVLFALAVERWIPRYLTYFRVGTGVFRVAVGTWQAWSMLART